MTLQQRMNKWIAKGKPNECWPWTGNIGGPDWRVPGKGYGYLTINGKKRRAHRIAYQLAHGPIPEGKNVLHKCDNTRCCNERHLFVGTQKDNLLDMARKKRSTAKLSDSQVIEMRTLKRTLSYGQLARIFGLSKAGVAHICKRLYYRHVP